MLEDLTVPNGAFWVDDAGVKQELLDEANAAAAKPSKSKKAKAKKSEEEEEEQ